MPIQRFLDLIPSDLPLSRKESAGDFTRDHKLTLPKLITFILSITASGKNRGVDGKSGEFFKNARRSGLWPDSKAIHRSALTKARKKVKWEAFEDIFHQATSLAHDLWPEDPQYLWHGMSVFAIDGSKHTLPATDELREKFDPQSGLENNGKGHYPQCLVSTCYDAFRRIPIARTVQPVASSEREEVKKLLPYIPSKSILLFDRGYPSYELIQYLDKEYSGHYLFRCPSTGTFPAVESFVKNKKKEDVIWLDPSNNFLHKINKKDRDKFEPVRFRIVRLVSPDGTVSVLLTSLLDKKEFPFNEIIALYFKRWEVESFYRDEKTFLEIEKFHSKKENGILQELYAVMIMSVISRTLMAMGSQSFFSGKKELQFKNAILTLASDAAFLVADDPQKATVIFKEILAAISRVKYYRPKHQRACQPRVNKQPVNKWNQSKIKKSTACA